MTEGQHNVKIYRITFLFHKSENNYHDAIFNWLYSNKYIKDHIFELRRKI